MNTRLLKEDEKDALVLDYIQRAEAEEPENYQCHGRYTVHFRDLKRYIAHDPSVRNWDNGYFDKLENAIEKIVERSVMPRPSIPRQKAEDVILANLVHKFYYCVFQRGFWGSSLTRDSVVKYLRRDPEIKKWNTDFLISVQHKVKEVKKVLLEK